MFSKRAFTHVSSLNKFKSHSNPFSNLNTYILQNFFSSSSNTFEQATANFGFQKVAEDEKGRLVGEVFSRVAEKYDLMNDLMSFGLHRYWKDRLVSELRPFPGMRHLDMAGGTGDVAFRIVRSIRSSLEQSNQIPLSEIMDDEDETKVYVMDINPNMLDVGKKRAEKIGLGNEPMLKWAEGNAEELSCFENESMDAYSIAFGLRNVTKINLALSEAYRVLKPGGRFLCLELSHVSTPIYKELYDIFSFGIIPPLGEMVAGDKKSYQYLVESIRKFPKQDKLSKMIAQAGFKNVQYENFLNGIVALHSGIKL